MALRPLTFRAKISVGTTAAALLVAGCAARSDTGQPSQPPRVDRAAQDISLGNASLAQRVRGLTLLVVGDSWARNLGVGAADADRDRRNIVVNAGEGGCGLMQPVQIRARGKMVTAPSACNTWPERWRDLVARYHPSAVLLEVGYWDGQDSQQLPGQDDVSSITEPVFRSRFDAQIDRAVRILSADGARVYVPTVIDNDGAARANSDAMNVAVRAAVRRNSQARLLDLHDQMCSPAKICPAEIAGIQVYDETGHPSGPAHDRLGAWILNSIYTDLHNSRSSLRARNQ
jgi:hypothetical protein